MANQYRTSISIVYWTADAASSQTISDAVTAAVPADYQDFVLVSVEYVATGEPVLGPAPEPEVV